MTSTYLYVCYFLTSKNKYVSTYGKPCKSLATMKGHLHRKELRGMAIGNRKLH